MPRAIFRYQENRRQILRVSQFLEVHPKESETLFGDRYVDLCEIQVLRC